MDQYIIKDGVRVRREPTLEEKVNKLLHYYELAAQSLIGRLPEYEKWGSGPYYRHRLACYQQFIRELKTIMGEKEHGNCN